MNLSLNFFSNKEDSTMSIGSRIDEERSQLLFHFVQKRPESFSKDSAVEELLFLRGFLQVLSCGLTLLRLFFFLSRESNGWEKEDDDDNDDDDNNDHDDDDADDDDDFDGDDDGDDGHDDDDDDADDDDGDGGDGNGDGDDEKVEEEDHGALCGERK